MTGDDETQPRLEQIPEHQLSIHTNPTFVCRRYIECSDSSIITPSSSPTIAPNSPITDEPSVAPSVSPIQQLTLQPMISAKDNEDDNDDDNGTSNAKIYGSMRIITLFVAFSVFSV